LRYLKINHYLWTLKMIVLLTSLNNLSNNIEDLDSELFGLYFLESIPDKLCILESLLLSH